MGRAADPRSVLTYQSPEDVDCEKSDGEGNEAQGLQSAVEVQVVLGSPQTQPARDGRQWRDEHEAGHVTQQRALLTARAWVPQPLGGCKERFIINMLIILSLLW